LALFLKKLYFLFISAAEKILYRLRFLVWNDFKRKRTKGQKKTIWKRYVGKQLLGIKLIKYNTKANLLSVSSFGTGKPTCSFDSFGTHILMAPTVRWSRVLLKMWKDGGVTSFCLSRNISASYTLLLLIIRKKKRGRRIRDLSRSTSSPAQHGFWI